jgi:hypothetical protein
MPGTRDAAIALVGIERQRREGIVGAERFDAGGVRFNRMQCTARGAPDAGGSRSHGRLGGARHAAALSSLKEEGRGSGFRCAANCSDAAVHEKRSAHARA